MTDLLRAWAAALVTCFVLVVVVGAFVVGNLDRPGELYLVAPFAGAAAAAWAHPAPWRDRFLRHLVATVPVPVGFAVLDAILVTSRIGGSIWTRRVGISTWLIATLAGVLVVRLLRLRRMQR